MSTFLHKVWYPVSGGHDPHMSQGDLRRVARAAAKVAKARAELEAAIVAAQASGETVRDIAPFAELSPSRIHQILQEFRQRQEPDAE